MKTDNLPALTGGNPRHEMEQWAQAVATLAPGEVLPTPAGHLVRKPGPASDSRAVRFESMHGPAFSFSRSVSGMQAELLGHSAP